MIVECIYTGTGRQRAVFLGPELVGGRFVLDLMDGDDACVETSFAPLAEVRRGRADWHPFEGGLGGSLEGLTALRVKVRRCDGWVKLTVWGEDKDAQ